MRNYETFDIDKFKNGLPFQLILDKWEIYEKSFKCHVDDIMYISVNKKIKNNDLLDVFSLLNFKINKYNFLFHNTAYDLKKITIKHVLENPSFFFFAPDGYIHPVYFKDRKCLIFKLKKDINDILDLTESIITINPFNKNKNIKNKHEKNKVWIDRKYTDIMNYYNNSKINYEFNPNSKCLIGKDKISINQFINNRPYCDTGFKNMYVGRRKLYEILLKTRKYDPSNIWLMEYLETIFCGMDIDVQKCYNDNLYHLPEKIKSNTPAYIYDTIFLKIFKLNGFFFTDYDVAIYTGGELLLVEPNKYLQLYKYSNKTCNNIIPLNDPMLLT